MLIMKALNFLSFKKILARLKRRITFALMRYLVYPVYISKEKFENRMDLLLITDENKPHYVYIKDFNRFMCNKTKNKNKKHFASIVYSVLVVKEI